MPRSRGGSDRPSNLVLSCHACNQTKKNRTAEEFGHPEVQAQAKAPLRDAACVGASTPQRLRWRDVVSLLITAQGWQRRQMCLMDHYGFPRTKAKQASRVQGFKTGDIVRAMIPASSSKAGTYVGKVAVRARGSFNLTTSRGLVTDISYRHCHPLHRADGYRYQKGACAFLPLP